MATAGVLIASAVAAEEGTAEDTTPAPVETVVDVPMQPIVDEAHRQYAPTVVVAASMPQLRVVAPTIRPTLPHRMVALPIVRLTPQHRMPARLTAAVADRMVAANITSL
jgi:hypothetical protein